MWVLEGACKVRTSRFTLDDRGTIPWATPSAEWAMVVRRSLFGPCWSFYTPLAIAYSMAGRTTMSVARMKGPSISSVGDFRSMGLITYAYSLVFGVYLVAFPFHVLLVAEIILLVVGPILLAGLGYVLVQQSILSPPARMQWASDFRGYGRFWLALILGAGAQVGLVVGFLKLNPNVRDPHPPSLILRITDHLVDYSFPSSCHFALCVLTCIPIPRHSTPTCSARATYSP